MSKVKTKIPSGSLTLLTKPNAAGECAVYLRYYLGSYIKKYTDIWVNQKDWDSKRQCVKSSAKNAARINARLYDIKGEIDKALLDYDGPITIDVIRSIMVVMTIAKFNFIRSKPASSNMPGMSKI